MTSPVNIQINELDPEIIPPFTSRMNDPNYNGGSKLVVVGKPGCFAAGTKVMMHDCTTKVVEDIKVGDMLMGDDSKPRNVIDLCYGNETMYKITTSLGETYTVNKNHILSLFYNGEKIDIVLKHFLDKDTEFQESCRWYKAPINFEYQKTNCLPNFFGHFLGKAVNLKLDTTDFNEYSPFVKDLKEFTRNNKIPDAYKYNNYDIRFIFLYGLLSEFDYEHDELGNLTIKHPSESLIDEIIFIVNSIGILSHKTKAEDSDIFYCNILHGYNKIIMLKDGYDYIYDKNASVDLQLTFSIEKKEYGKYYGFIIDMNHRFLGADFSVLHNTGKSTLIKGLMYAKKHIFPVGIAMSGSEDTNHAFAEVMPSTFVYNEYNEDKIKDFVKRQKLSKMYLANPWALMIIDDCTDDPKVFNKPLQGALYKKGRHWKMTYILSLQYAMDIKPQIRTNIDGVFILREPIESNREKLYHNFASIIPSYNLFCQLMDQITEDYHALYIHNATHSNNWKDCVFYWKAPITPKNWKFGCPEYWEFHESRYNTDYQDPIEF